jgi:predicted PhzF superfamily epimerase YddE/YHI9
LPGKDGRYLVSQGREVGHDALLRMEVDAENAVWSGGHACTVVRGVIDWR